MGGIGQGIANAGNAIGLIGVRDYEMRQAHALREDERQNQRDWQEQQKQDQRDWQAGQNEIYKRTADQKGGTGGMKGFAPEDIAPGGKLADMVAGQMGMTVPQYEQFYNARKTGDMSYAQVEGEPVVAADEARQMTTVTPTKKLPEGFQKEFAAKSKMLSDIQQSYVAGSEAKNIAEGRQIGLVTNAMADVQAGNLDATKAAQISAIGKGHVPFGGTSEVDRNLITGESKLTGLGTAAAAEKTAGAAENTAQAGAASALADKHKEEINKIKKEVEKLAVEIPEVKARTEEIRARTGKVTAETGEVGKDKKGQTQERLSTVINSANATLKSLEDNGPGKTPASKTLWEQQRADAVALRDEAIRLQKEALGARGTPPPAADTSGHKVGDTQVVQAGTNKGKTVKWDGKGWVLQ